VREADGQQRPVQYLRRRFLPPASDGGTLALHTVVQGDRLDNVTAQYLGDPTQFWRVCDANNVLRPDDLTAEPGERIRIGVPKL
jgi:hypothetical protein